MNTINHTYNWTQTRYIKLPDHWPSVPRSPLCPTTSDSDSENTEEVTLTTGHNFNNEVRPAVLPPNSSRIPSTTDHS
ncbi:MAG: hypothetical protein LBB17_00930 [Puniceicoccales bacterium]|nr:hypothetical protein [Puniceicoccales bacterium]